MIPVKATSTPSQVKITDVSISSNNITLTYKKVKNVVGYKIYRMENDKFVHIKTTNKTTYKDSNLKYNKTYQYKIRAYKKVNGKTIFGKYSSIKSGKTSPKTPSFTLSSYDYNKVKITINKVSGAISYKVYRSSKKNGTYTCIGSTSESIIDTKLKTGKTYYYKVKAVGKSGKVKTYSKISSYKTIAPKLKTASFKVSLTDKGVKISIDKVNGASNYQIYKATSKKGSYTYLKNTTSNTFTDTSVGNKTYYYKVRSFKVVDKKRVHSSYSSVISISVPKLYQTGKYVVSKQIEPGLYRVLNNSNMGGYISRLNSLDIGMESIIASNMFISNGYVEIKSSDYAVEVNGVTIYKIDYDTYKGSIKNSYSSGRYLVNKDILPGIYKVSDIKGLNGYIERLSKVDMESSSIIKNKYFIDNGYIEIKSSDYAINIESCTIEKIDYDSYLPNVLDEYKDGMYLIGKDILPGTYEVKVVDENNYVKVLKGVSLEDEELLNNSYESDSTITISDGFAIDIKNIILKKID